MAEFNELKLRLLQAPLTNVPKIEPRIPRDCSTITCFEYHEKGHVRDDCPRLLGKKENDKLVSLLDVERDAENVEVQKVEVFARKRDMKEDWYGRLLLSHIWASLCGCS